MNPSYIYAAFATIVLTMISFGVWLLGRGHKRIGAKIAAQVKFQRENPHTAALLGELFPKRSRRIDEGTILLGLYLIAFAAYIVFSITMSGKTIWMVTFGALAFCGVGIMIAGRNEKGAIKMGFLIALTGAATVLATLFGTFPLI